MKVILYTGVSVDGFIAKEDGDSDWVAEFDGEVFDRMVEWADVVMVGRRTFEQFEGEFYPLKGVLNVIVSKERSDRGDNWVCVSSPQAAVELARKRGFEKVLIAGGGELNGSFLRAGLVDEVVVSVIPKVIGKGVRVFEKFEDEVDLKLIESEVVEDKFVKMRCKVAKK